MDISLTFGVWVFLVVAVGSIGGGLVLYRQSRRVGWRAVGMSATTLGLGVLVVSTLTLPVFQSSEGKTPEPVVVKGLVPDQPNGAKRSLQEPDAPVSAGMMVPRPSSVEDFVAQASVILLGTIDSVLGEKRIGPYGEDGKPTPVSDEGGLPYTDYKVLIEDVLKGDGKITDGGTLVLRMFGHLSNSGAIITPNVFIFPKPGDYLLFALGRNPDGTYGSGAEGLLNVDSEPVTHIDGLCTSSKQVGQKGSL